MPFRRATLSTKRFIAGVGGRSPASQSTAAPSTSGPAAPSLSLPMMRWATSHTASIAPTISCLPITTSSRRHSSCAVTPGSTSAGSACSRTPNSDRPVSVGTMFFSLGDQKTLFLQPSDDLRSGRRRADALGLLQALAQNLVIDKAPGVLHCLDQGALIVARRGAGLLVLDGRVFQPCDLAVAEGW